MPPLWRLRGAIDRANARSVIGLSSGGSSNSLRADRTSQIATRRDRSLVASRRLSGLKAIWSSRMTWTGLAARRSSSRSDESTMRITSWLSAVARSRPSVATARPNRPLGRTSCRTMRPGIGVEDQDLPAAVSDDKTIAAAQEGQPRDWAPRWSAPFRPVCGHVPEHRPRGIGQGKPAARRIECL